jgi:outer membrane protein TolC
MRPRASAAVTSLLLPALALAQANKPPPFAPAPRPRQEAPARAVERVTFAEVVRRATAASTQAIIAAEEVRRAEALLEQARSASLPNVSATASYTRFHPDRVAVVAPRAGSTTPGVLRFDEQGNAAFVLQIPLFAPSRWASWAAASEGVSVARMSQEDVRRTAVLVAARAYLAVLAQRRVIDVSRSARDIARARFDFAHARRSGGIGNAVDEMRAEQQLATSEVQLASGEVGLVRAQEALAAATGSDAPLDAADEPDFSAAPAPAQPEERRPDVVAARERVRGADVVRRYSWTDWLPTLLFTGQAFPGDPFTGSAGSTGWQVQFLITLPLFEGGLRVGQLHEREAIEREATATLDAALRQARSDVRLAVEEVQRQEGALGQARLAGERARSVLDLQTQAYKAGAANDLDVTTAQQQSRDADLATVIAEDGVRQARLDLLSAIGQFP